MSCKVVNLLGGPGVGKSVMMARLFTDLKVRGINAEMVSEFAKDLVYENRMDTMKDELYIFAKQNHRLFRVKDKVDVVVTDRPLLLTCTYDKRYGTDDTALHKLVRRTFDSYDNINIFLRRDFDYHTEGRLQDEVESEEISKEISKELGCRDCLYVYSTDYESILEYVLDKLEVE